ncbi:SDR family oxidoreductase [Dehalococcoidia bacterium]|nr:SDR family oxidoreductase [Dehalococcoidia bacterium]
MTLNNKVCLITGGGSGIGRATANKMAEEGATIVVVGRTQSKIDETVSYIQKNGGNANGYTTDVSDQKSVDTLVSTVIREHSKIDLLLNNAGHSSKHRRLTTTTATEIQSVIDSNLIGTIYCSQAIVPYMIAAGEGTIINVASIAGLNPSNLGGMIYSAVKAAVINFTGFLNDDLKNTGIRASVVIPGEVDTPILDNRPIPPNADARAKMVTSEDTAEAISMIARLPLRTNIPELQIRPTFVRDNSEEIEKI